MKKIITLIIISLFVFVESCKKDEVNSIPKTKYTVNILQNNKLLYRYAYNSDRLLQYHFYTNGVLADTVEFNYDSGKLNSIVKVSIANNNRLTTYYEYNSDGLLVRINEASGHYYEKVFDISYDNEDQMNKIKWNMTNKPFNGEFSINNFGNVDKYKYNHVSSIGNHHEVNALSFEQFKNVIQPFWIMSPDEISISVNNPVEQINNVEVIGVGNPSTYETNVWKYKYTYNSDGYVVTKAILDTNNVVIGVFEFQYLQD